MDYYIYQLKKSDLEKMSKEEITKLIKQEWRTSIFNEKYKWEFNDINNELAVQILNVYFLDRANIELSNNNPDDPFKAKLNGSLTRKFKGKEDVFYESLKLLLLNGYLQKVKLLDVEIQELLNVEFADDFYQGYLRQVTHERNMYWIFANHRELFEIDCLAEQDDLVLMEHGSLLFSTEETSETIYNKISSYGTIIDLLCEPGSVLSLSHKGMYLLQIEQYHKSQGLVKDQRDMLNALDSSKTELISKISDTENELAELHKEMKEEFINHKHKIKSFYKDIASILSILVAAFSFIGVNISAIPKIESNFAVNVLIMNLSLSFVLVIMFYILKKTIFLMPGESIKEDRFWIVVPSCLLFLIIILFITTKFYDAPNSNIKRLQSEVEKQEQTINEQINKINNLYEELQKNISNDNSLREDVWEAIREINKLKVTQ